MSDSNNTDARNHRADVSRFAPRRHRVSPDDAEMLPLLERLEPGRIRWRVPCAKTPNPYRRPSRSGARHAPPAGPRLPLSATGRIAVVLGLVVAVTAVSAALLKSKAQHPATTDTAKAPKAPSAKPARAKDQAKVQPTVMPRTVRTVEIRPQAATAPTTPAENTLSATTGAGTAQALPAALKSWAMFPDTAAQASGFATTDGSKVEDAKTSERTKQSEPTKRSDPTKEAAGKAAVPRHKAKAKRTARRHRRHYRGRHRRVRTAVKPQPVQQAQAAPPPTTTEPIEKMPIQAALDSIFGNSGGGGGDVGASGGNSVPMTTGAAFQ